MAEQNSQQNLQKKREIYVDIDNTICETTGMDYENSIPIKTKIAEINSMYDTNNCNITYWSARGMKSGIDYLPLTTKQFKEWGVKYHKISLTKPPFDLFIDDKAINAKWGWNPAAVNEVLCPGYNATHLRSSPSTSK